MSYTAKHWNDIANFKAKDLNEIELGLQEAHEDLDILNKELVNIKIDNDKTIQDINNLLQNSGSMLNTLQELESIMSSNDDIVNFLTNYGKDYLSKSEQHFTSLELKTIYKNLNLVEAIQKVSEETSKDILGNHDTSNTSHEDIREMIRNIQIPNISNLVTEQKLQEALSNINFNDLDLSNYALLNHTHTGMATESFVLEQVKNIPTPDVSGQINDHNIKSDSHKVLFDFKLDKTLNSKSNQVYGVTDNGAQTMYAISKDIVNNSIVIRDGQQIKVPLTPIQNNDAVSKQYLDQHNHDTTYAAKVHSHPGEYSEPHGHPYLPLTGGIITSDIVLNGTAAADKRATLQLISSDDTPNDLIFGSKGSNHWSLTSRASDMNHQLAIYNYGLADYALAVYRDTNNVAITKNLTIGGSIVTNTNSTKALVTDGTYSLFDLEAGALYLGAAKDSGYQLILRGNNTKIIDSNLTINAGSNKSNWTEGLFVETANEGWATIGLGAADKSRLLALAVNPSLGSYRFDFKPGDSNPYQINFPNKSGTFALTSDLSNYALKTGSVIKLETADGRITNANVTHTYENSKAHLQLLQSSSAMTSNKPAVDGYIMHFSWDNSGVHDAQIAIPNNEGNGISPQYRICKDGSWAASSGWHNFITDVNDQTIIGMKTFNAPTDIAATETITTKLMTSNGGSIKFGKEGPNSGTMIRLDQIDGTPRLRFRASATPGAMVWEQPEQDAALYIDLGKKDSDYHRIVFPNSGGTLALEGHTHTGYAKLSGGNTFEGIQRIKGSAASHPLWVRGIVGCETNSPTTLSDLYLNYETDFPVHFGKSGTGQLNSDGTITEAGTLLSNKYAAKSHTHDYVPLGTVSASTVSTTNLNSRIVNIEDADIGIGQGNYIHLINLGGYTSGNFTSQIAMPYINSLSDSKMYIRTANGDNWRSWREVITTGNIGSQLSSYLPLSAGSSKVITGAITSSLATQTHLSGNQGKAIINSTAGAGYNMLFRMKSSNGVFTGGAYNADFNIYYTADSTISAGTNTITKTTKLMNESGDASFGNNVSVAGYVNASSDKRLKENIIDVDENSLKSFIENTPIKAFNYKENGNRTVGVIAQDIENLEIDGAKFTSTNEDGYLQVHETKFVYLLWNYCQQLNKRIKELESKVK